MSERRSCGSYHAGHQVHWIQAKKSREEGQPIISVKVVAVRDDGRVELEGPDLNATRWYHNPGRLRSMIHFDTEILWKPKYYVLEIVPSHLYSLGRVEDARPCLLPIETARQFIGRTMRDYTGYTARICWRVHLDAISDGDTGEPQAGFLVPVDYDGEDAWN